MQLFSYNNGLDFQILENLAWKQCEFWSRKLLRSKQKIDLHIRRFPQKRRWRILMVDIIGQLFCRSYCLESILFGHFAMRL